MSIVNQPLLYVALSFAGMFLCAWLFDRAYKRHMPETDDPEPAKLPLSRVLLNMSGAILVAVILWFALHKTNMVVVDLLLLAALASFAIGSYKIRLRPLLAHGLTMPHLAALIAALGLWAMPMLWFFHLHLAKSYGAA